MTMGYGGPVAGGYASQAQPGGLAYPGNPQQYEQAAAPVGYPPYYGNYPQADAAGLAPQAAHQL